MSGIQIIYTTYSEYIGKEIKENVTIVPVVKL